jgi:hypothetical protein
VRASPPIEPDRPKEVETFRPIACRIFDRKTPLIKKLARHFVIGDGVRIRIRDRYVWNEGAEKREIPGLATGA